MRVGYNFVADTIWYRSPGALRRLRISIYWLCSVGLEPLLPKRFQGHLHLEPLRFDSPRRPPRTPHRTPCSRETKKDNQIQPINNMDNLYGGFLGTMLTCRAISAIYSECRMFKTEWCSRSSCWSLLEKQFLTNYSM